MTYRIFLYHSHIVLIGPIDVGFIHMSHEKKKKNLLLSIESWLVNRDPYNGVW